MNKHMKRKIKLNFYFYNQYAYYENCVILVTGDASYFDS
jgi:hypothetical protein